MRGCTSAAASPPSTVAPSSIGTSYSYSSTSQAPSADILSMHLLSNSSSCPQPLRPLSLAASPDRRAWSSSSGHQVLMYPDRLAYKAPSIPDTKSEQRLRLLQAYFTMVHVTNRTYLDRRQYIISLIPTKKPWMHFQWKQGGMPSLPRWMSREVGYFLTALPSGMAPPGGVMTMIRRTCTSS